VETFKVMVSQTGESWKYVECGRIFDGNTNRNDIVRNEFDYPVSARYVRIYPETSYYGFDMRAGVLMCESLCSSGELKYDLTRGLTSTTDGPALEAPWGLGTIDSASGYRFAKEKGLELDEHNCITKPKFWSVLMDVKLDEVSGYRSLMTSTRWKGNGPAVLDGTFVVKPTGLVCDEPIRIGYYYKFGATRSIDGEMSVYLNGYPCMTSEPTSSKGFPLEEHDMIFFKGVLGESSAGYVRKIEVWEKTLTAADMLKASSCALPQESTAKCGGYIYYSPSYDKYTASSIYGDYKMGWDHYGHPKLGESYCWKSKTNTAGEEWLQIDTGSLQAVAGVVVQGRSNYARWVQTFKVMVSQRGKTWTYVQCGRIFDGNTDYTTKVEVVFDKPVEARYVRIYPETSQSGFDMRAAVLLCETNCTGGKLEYDLTSGLTSETGGPSLRVLNGDGSYSSKGYRFVKGQGLEVDESNCIKTPKSYTIFMDVRLDSTDKSRVLIRADDWDSAGVYVKDGFFSVLPIDSNIVCDKERIRPNYYYRFAITRSQSNGDVTLYMNGYPCASGTPKTAQGFALDPDNIQFFQGMSEQSSGGYVKKIEIWDKALSAGEIKNHTGCSMPVTGKACSGFIQLVPPYEKWTASSILSNYKMGQNYWGKPRLDDTYAWIPANQASVQEEGRNSQQNGEWLQVDLGNVMGVAGLITQGRSDAWQYAKTYKVMVSQTGETWKHIECGRIFDGNVDYYTKKQNLFDQVVKARYVRIYPEECYSYCAMRVGIVVCEKGCTNGELDYTLKTGNLKSVTDGPMITVPWGTGSVVANIGYRFAKERGFKVDQAACITDPSEYSLLVNVRFDEVDGERSIMESDSWFSSGFYIGDGLLQWRPSRIICKDEPIRANQFYNFGVTVGDNGKVALYLNGQLCAGGTPKSGPGTKLDADNMMFFHGDEEKSSAGYVKRIRIWKKTLSATEMATASDCSFPPKGKECSAGDVVHVPPHTKYEMSSCYYSSIKMGKHAYALPKINSAGAWIAGSSQQNQNQWLQIDLKLKQDVVGVVTQGRYNVNQWVQTYKVSVSDDGKDFTEVECGRIFDGNTDYNSKVRNYFMAPVKARYIRVHPVTWYSLIAMRLGVLTCETSCKHERLDYEMQGSESSTGGPVLHYPWGVGFFTPKELSPGTNFPGNDLGYQNLKPSDCIKKCKERRDCVGVVTKSDQDAAGCWPKFALANVADSNDLDSVFRTDTLYYKLRTPYGYRVNTGQGIQLATGKCVETQKEYSLVVEMAIDRATGNAVRLFSSKDWGQKGAFVYNGQYAMYPWFRGLKCQEDIKAGFFYKFGLTRSEDRKISIYLNGWMCASAYPPYANAFAIDEQTLDILQDAKAAYNSAGYVRRIQVWSDAMSPTDMLSANDCKLSIMKERSIDQWEKCADQNGVCRCNGVIRYGVTRYGEPVSDRWSGPHMAAGGVRNCNDGEFGDPAPGVVKMCQCNAYNPTVGVSSSKVTYSSVKDGNTDEWGRGNGLDNERCWAPGSPNMDEWLQIDFGKNETIGMVSTQGDPRRNWQVTGFIIEVSYDEEEWLDVQCGRIWNTPWEGNRNKIYTIELEKPVLARYIRFLPITWSSYPAMRVSVARVTTPAPPPPSPPPPPPPTDEKTSDDKKTSEEETSKEETSKESKVKEASVETLAENNLVGKDGKSLLNKYCADYRDAL